MKLVLYKMEDIMLIIATVVILAASRAHCRAAERTKFGRKWDTSYTLKVDMKKIIYDGEETSSSVYIYKRNMNSWKYQEWSKKRGLIAIEQKDASGTLWRYHHIDEKEQRCEKYRKTRLDGVWRDDMDGNMDDELVNTYREGKKIYLQYYLTYYVDGGRFKRWWTTVYDTETGSYLPYKRDEYWNDWETRYSFVSITNYTYTPTTMLWVTLPHYC